MIITDVKPIKLQFWPPNPPRDGLAAIPTRDVFLVQIETDAGITGIGEGFALGSLESLATLTMETLKPLLLGQDPTMIEALWNRMYLGTARYGRRGIMMAAISAGGHRPMGHSGQSGLHAGVQAAGRGQAFADSLCQRPGITKRARAFPNAGGMRRVCEDGFSGRKDQGRRSAGGGGHRAGFTRCARPSDPTWRWASTPTTPGIIPRP